MDQVEVGIEYHGEKGMVCWCQMLNVPNRYLKMRTS